jgi:IS30 family transposase
MKKKRLTIENRLLIDQLLRLNYNLKDIANIIETESSTISREIKKRRVKGNILPDNCNKVNRFPFVCNGCLCKSYCKKQKYYYNYLKAQENYVNTLKNSRIGIDMTIDEIDFWNDYFKDKIKNKNQPITHLFNSIENQFPKSIQTFYNYIHKGYFTSVNDEMLARAFSYKPRKRHNEITTLRFDNFVKSGRKLIDLNEYLENHPNASVVEMDTVIGKFEDKKCIMTLYFKNCKLMLMFLIDKYKPNAVKKIFKKLQDTLGIENFKMLFEVIVTDNGWEFSKPGELEIDYKTSEKCINIYYCEPYSSWQKGGIERNHEFIRYIIPKGITFDKLTDQNINDMMNNINSVTRKSLNYKTPYLLFKNIYGENITKKLHLKPIKKDEVNLSYKILIK